MQDRLQKIIASAGVCSRRAAEELILGGGVTVNGEVVTRLGTKADPERDHIKVRGKLISASASGREKHYVLLNKPRGYLCSLSDPIKRALVVDLVPGWKRLGLHPVGRLDFNSEGLIILTNDGDLTRLLTQAGKVPKVYHVKVKGSPNAEKIARIRRGIRFGDARVAPEELRLLEKTAEGGNAWYEVTLKQGKNQQIRKMFEAIGHSVTKLRRVRIGHLTDRGLEPGQYRELKPGEVKRFMESQAGRSVRANR